jgi:hypothetical protein
MVLVDQGNAHRGDIERGHRLGQRERFFAAVDRDRKSALEFRRFAGKNIFCNAEH